MHQIFLDPETEGVYLVDAANAFEHKQPDSNFLQYHYHLVYQRYWLTRIAKHPWEWSTVEAVKMHY